MGTAMDVVLEFFKGNGWKYELDEESQRVRSGISGDNGEWHFYISASDGEGLCFVLSVFPQKCPEKRRGRCAELLALLNYGLLLGSFEMDFETGNIHLKTSYPFPEGQMDGEVFKNVISHNIEMMDKCLPAIMSVLYAGTTPKRAFAAMKTEAKTKAKRKARTPGLARRFRNN